MAQSQVVEVSRLMRREFLRNYELFLGPSDLELNNCVLFSGLAGLMCVKSSLFVSFFSHACFSFFFPERTSDVRKHRMENIYLSDKDIK